MFMSRLARFGRLFLVVGSVVLAIFGIPIIVDPPPRTTAAEISESPRARRRKPRPPLDGP